MKIVASDDGMNAAEHDSSEGMDGADAAAFARRAMQENLLVVPGDPFGVPGYVRVAYCVSRETIERSLPTWRKLAAEYGLGK